MDTFENDEFTTNATTPVSESNETVNTQSEPQQPEAENASPAPEAPRRESPYANSPYSRSPYTYDPSYSPYAKAPKKKAAGSGTPFWKRAAAAMLTVALVSGGCCITAFTVNSKWEKRNSQTVAVMNQKIEDLQKQINAASNRTGSDAITGNTVNATGLTPSQVYAQNVASVVGISSQVQTTSIFGQTATGTSSGSGFIISADGYVVTNYHVVEGGSSIEVLMSSGDSYPAKVVGTDSINDVAVLKVDAEDLPYAVIGSSDNLSIGDMVVAIGNPLGQLTATQTVGYVSGKDREVNTDSTVINMIQTDAAINSGNSGGPLFNMKGEVVGITTAKYSGTTSSGASIEGIGFAIPIDDVQSVIGDLRDLGYISGAYLGVTVVNVDASSAALYNLPTGAYVQSVVAGGAAEKAGIEVKDIIIRLGDYDVANITSLTRALRHYNAGDTAVITVIRCGQHIDQTVTQDARPQDLDSNSAAADPAMPDEGNYDEWFEYFRKHFQDAG